MQSEVQSRISHSFHALRGTFELKILRIRETLGIFSISLHISHSRTDLLAQLSWKSVGLAFHGSKVKFLVTISYLLFNLYAVCVMCALILTVCVTETTIKVIGKFCTAFFAEKH